MPGSSGKGRCPVETGSSSLFFLVLPLANGFWDWASWYFTRRLGGHLLAKLTTGRKLALAVLGHGIADLTLALLLLFSMAYVLALGFELYNQIALAQGRAVFTLGRFIQAAAAEPFTIGAWLTAMLGTTLLPTLGHGVILLASPLAVLFVPDQKRRELADRLDGYGGQRPDGQAATRMRVARWLARGRLAAWLVAAVLLVVLLALILALLSVLVSGRLFGWVLVENGFAGIVLLAAEWGIATAEALGRLFLRGAGGSP